MNSTAEARSTQRPAEIISNRRTTTADQYVAKRKSETYNPYSVSANPLDDVMPQRNEKRDYYDILGVDEHVSRAELDRQYKRKAAEHHPDRGGNEESMKSLNEAYSVLRDAGSKQAYDLSRKHRTVAANFVPASSPVAQDVGVFGHGLSALLCLMAGGFLLLLVRFQGIWFLWPLAFLAIFVLGFGVLMARSALRAASATLPVSNLLRRHAGIQEVAFWLVVGGGIYGLYLVLTQ